MNQELIMKRNLHAHRRWRSAWRSSGSIVPARRAVRGAARRRRKTVVFAGGCFWGIQAVFQHTKGVVSATSGYAGGTVDQPDYEQVSTGRTGHAESVRVVFDPSQVSYGQLMRVFFSVAHDPTLLNRQGPDVGTQYRSAIFYIDRRAEEGDRSVHRPAQQVARLPAADRDAGGGVHEVLAGRGVPSELRRAASRQPYIAINDAPKVVNLRRSSPSLYTDKLAAHDDVGARTHCHPRRDGGVAPCYWRIDRTPPGAAPGQRNVALLGADVSDRQPQREPVVQLGVRQKHLAAVVHGVHDSLVERVALRRLMPGGA